MAGGIQWMVRMNGKHLLGPYTIDQLHEMFLEGMLSREDEVCPENSYWFSVFETAELKDFFDDISDFRFKEERSGSDDEVTQPDLHGPDEKTKPIVVTATPKLPPPRVTLSQEMLNSSRGINAPASSAQSKILGLSRERFWDVLLFVSLILVGLIIRWVLQSLD